MPELTPYALRHKMATEMRARGVSREELAYQMGHKLPDLGPPTAIPSSTSDTGPQPWRRSNNMFAA